jgi:competence protein ComEA
MSRMKPVLAMTAAALLVSAAIVFAEDTPSTTSPAPATQAAPSKSTTKTHTSTTTSSTHHSTMPKLDLNTATPEELAKLPGLDAAIADKIVAARPYKSRSDLVNKKIISKSEYSKIESHITVKTSSAPKSSTAK